MKIKIVISKYVNGKVNLKIILRTELMETAKQSFYSYKNY